MFDSILQEPLKCGLHFFNFSEIEIGARGGAGGAGSVGGGGWAAVADEIGAAVASSRAFSRLSMVLSSPSGSSVADRFLETFF
jgi:hypothetical protein